MRWVHDKCFAYIIQSSLFLKKTVITSLDMERLNLGDLKLIKSLLNTEPSGVTKGEHERPNTALFCLICCLLWLTPGMYAIVRGLFVGSEHRLCAPISRVVLCTRYVFLHSLLGLYRCRLACRSCGHLEVILSYNLEFWSELSTEPGCDSSDKIISLVANQLSRYVPTAAFATSWGLARQRAVSVSPLLGMDLIRNLMMWDKWNLWKELYKYCF